MQARRGGAAGRSVGRPHLQAGEILRATGGFGTEAGLWLGETGEICFRRHSVFFLDLFVIRAKPKECQVAKAMVLPPGKAFSGWLFLFTRLGRLDLGPSGSGPEVGQAGLVDGQE